MTTSELLSGEPDLPQLAWNPIQHADDIQKCTFSLHLSLKFQTFQLSTYFLEWDYILNLIFPTWNYWFHIIKPNPPPNWLILVNGILIYPEAQAKNPESTWTPLDYINISPIIQSCQPYFPNRSQVSSLSSLPALVPATMDPAWTPESALQLLSWFYISISVSTQHLESSCKIKLNKN